MSFSFPPHMGQNNPVMNQGLSPELAALVPMVVEQTSRASVRMIFILAYLKSASSFL